MADQKLGVLIHGAGWVSTQHIAAFHENPDTEIVAISSRSMSSCGTRAEEAGLEGVGLYAGDFGAALAHDGVDIVSICTPQHLHCENTLAAAAAGKHLIIEKPIANTVDEMRQMRDAVHAAGVRTCVSFVLRWNPLFETIKAMVADDALGDIYYAETDYEHDIGAWWTGYEDARKKETGVSALLVGGCHAIDALRWFAAKGQYEAATPVEVFAYSGGYRKGQREYYNYTEGKFDETEPLEYDGFEVALVKFDNGATGKVSVNFDCVCPYTFPVEIFGSKGTVRDNKVWSHKYPGQRDWVEIPSILPDSADVAHHPFQGEIDHFVECILGDKESHANLDDAILTHEIALAAQICYETGQPVKLPLLQNG